MAYRELVGNDRVKIMQKGHYAFGTFGKVVSTLGAYADVKMGDSNKWFLQSDLMVAHDALHGLYTTREYYTDSPHTLDTSEDEEHNEYEGWDTDDFIARIKQLERQIEEIEK